MRHKYTIGLPSGREGWWPAAGREWQVEERWHCTECGQQVDRSEVWNRRGKDTYCSRTWGQRQQPTVARLRGRRSSQGAQS